MVRTDMAVAGDGLFAAGPQRFVESGALGRLVRRLAEPRRAVKLPDAAHDFHAVWGVPLPRDLAAVVRALAAVDLEWLGRWRPGLSESFVLPPRAGHNLVDRILKEGKQPDCIFDTAFEASAGEQGFNVAVLCEYYNLVVVNSEKIPATTLAEFVELLKKNPGKYNFASNGARLGIELFKLETGVDVTIVPYRGASDAITGLIRGDADFMIVNAPGLMPHIASGKLRALAVTGPKRDPDLPSVPTTAEAGLPQFTYSSFFGAYVPAATPADIVAKLAAALNTITAMPDVVAQFRQQGAVAVQSTPAEAARKYDSTIASYKDIVVKAKIPPAD